MDDTNFTMDLKNKMLSKILSKQKEFDETFLDMEKNKEISNNISILEMSIKKVIETQTKDLTLQYEEIYVKVAEILKQQMLNLTEQFEKINGRITEIVNKLTLEFTSRFGDITDKISQTNTEQIKELTSQVRNIKDTMSLSIEKLQLGVLQKSVSKVIADILNSWLINVPASLLRPIRAIQQTSDDDLKHTEETLNEYFNEIKQTNLDGIVTTSIDINKQLKLVQDLSREGLEKITEKLNTHLNQELKISIGKTIKSINELTASAASSGDNVKEIFSEISDDFITILEKQKGDLDTSRGEGERLQEEKMKLEEEAKRLEMEKKGLEIATRKLAEAKNELEQDKMQLEKDKQERDQTIGAMTDEQRRLLDEYEKLKVELQKFASAADETTQSEYNFNRIKALLSIYRVLIEEIWQGHAEYKILLNLHGKKEFMSKEELKKATGVGGAFVLKALNELNRIGLLEYDMNTDIAKLKKRLFPKSDLD